MTRDSQTAMSSISSMPVLLIELDQREIDLGDHQRLTEVLVRQQLSLPTLCELTFVNPVGSLAEGVPRLGSVLSVTVDGERLFLGDVTAAEFEYSAGGMTLRVRSYDVLHRLRKRQTVRALTNLTPSDLASELLRADKVSVEAEVPGPVWQRLIQWRQSDFDLLADVCDRCGLYFSVRQDVVRLITMQGSGTPLPLVLGQNLLQVRLGANSDSVWSSVCNCGVGSIKVGTSPGRSGSGADSANGGHGGFGRASWWKRSSHSARSSVA